MGNDTASETNGIPVETIEPSGFLSWEMVDEANAFDDSDPDDGEAF